MISEAASDAFLELDGDRRSLGALKLVLSRGDWNLGRDGAFWLAGTAEPPPRSLDDLPSTTLWIDERSLDETVANVCGVTKTFYPPGGWNAPRMTLRVESARGGRVVLSFAAELDWDYHPAPTKPADYRPHRLRMHLVACVEGLDA